MATSTTLPVDAAAVRSALVELLTTGQHHHAATPATLTAVGLSRAALDERHHTGNPAASFAAPGRRLTALTAGLGATAAALFTATPGRPRDIAALHAALTELAAIALGWLDTLPTSPPAPHPGADLDDVRPF